MQRNEKNAKQMQGLWRRRFHAQRNKTAHARNRRRANLENRQKRKWFVVKGGKYFFLYINNHDGTKEIQQFNTQKPKAPPLKTEEGFKFTLPTL